MSDVRGKKLSVLCYIEGYNIPIKSVSISCQQGVPSIATIDIPPTRVASDILPTTHIVLFVRYSSFGDKREIRDQYSLLFHGEITGVRSSKNGINMSYQVMAVDSRTYLNRLPSHMLYKLYASNIDPPFFPNIADDAKFYGIPKEDALTAYFETIGGVIGIASKPISLEGYVNRILSLLKYNNTYGYNYYANANYRFNIQGNHSVIDFGDTFKELWGAITKSCILNNTTQRIIESNGTTMDALAADLSTLGYLYISTIFPKYISDSLGKRMVEYIVTRDLINHRVPKFNYIYVDRDDNFDAMIVPTRLTALKYKYKITDNTYPIDNDIYPKDCMTNEDVRGSFKMTEEEKIYGINRESIEMEYFYSAFLKDAAGEKPEYYQKGKNKENIRKKIAYDFIVKRTGMNSLSIAKSGFYPQYVLGIPTLVYDPMTERVYRGNISRLAYSINMEAGSCVTTMEAVNAVQIKDRNEINSDREDVNPFGKESFKDKELAFYQNHFYDSDKESVLLESSEISSSMKMADYERIIDRPMCTMKQYLSMYYAKDYEQQNSIPEDLFEDYVTAKGGDDKTLTYQTFSTNTETVYFKKPVKEKIYFLFIEDRRMPAKRLQEALGERILYV